MSSIRKFFQPILKGVSRTFYGERPFKPRHVMVSVMPCLLKPRTVKPPVGLATSFAEMQRSVVRSRVRLEMKRKRTLALRRLLKNLHLYDLKFEVSPNLAKDKALLVFHPYHKLPSKARVKRFEEEQSKGKKHTIMDSIWATLIICGLIKQSSKLASWASDVYPEYFTEKKGEGWKEAIINMGRDFLELLKKNDREEAKKMNNLLLEVRNDLREHARQVVSFNFVWRPSV